RAPVATSQGVSIQRYYVEPDVVAPGGELHVSTVWRIDVEGADPVALAVLRVGNRVIARGSGSQIKGNVGEGVTVDFGVPVPPQPPNVDYQVTMMLGTEPAVLGIVRVRAR